MRVHQPVCLEQALEERGARETTVLAGGTDLMVDVNRRGVRPPALLDLSRVAELAVWSRGHVEISVGATTTLTSCLEALRPPPALAQACRTVGSRQVRNRATIGGNVVTASPAGDLLPFLVASDAVAVLASAERGVRDVAVGDLLTGPRTTSIAADELLIALRWEERHGRQWFSRVGRRAAMDLALASSCVVIDTDRRAVRIALGAVAATVIRASKAELIAAEALTEAGWWEDNRAPVDHEASWAAAHAAAACTEPIDDVRGTARYRRHAVGVLVHRQLQALAGARRA